MRCAKFLDRIAIFSTFGDATGVPDARMEKQFGTNVGRREREPKILAQFLLQQETPRGALKRGKRACSTGTTNPASADNRGRGRAKLQTTQKSASRSQQMLKNVLLSTASLVIAFAIGELACRSFYNSTDNTMSVGRNFRETLHIEDRQLGWVPKPSTRGEQALALNPTTTYTTNTLGLRNREIRLNKQPGVTRIALAGDSFTWGWGVNDDETFAALLEVGRSDRETINLGVIGYGLVQEMHYFRRVGAQFKPDVLLLAFCENDVVSATHDFLARPTHHGHETTPHEPRGVARLKRLLSDSSATYRLLNGVVRSHHGLMRIAVGLHLKDSYDDVLDDNLAPFLKTYPPALESQWSATLAQLLDFKALADAGGARFIVAIIPALQSIDINALRQSIAATRYEVGDFDLARPYRALSKFCLENGIELVDPTETFSKAQSNGTVLYLRGDMHFSAAGHRIFAKSISERLDGLYIGRNARSGCPSSRCR